MSTKLAVLGADSRTAGPTLFWQNFGPNLWPYRVGRTVIINALAMLGFLGAPEILMPVERGLGADILAIVGVAPFLLDGVNGLIHLLHDLPDELVMLNATSLATNALLWLILGIRRPALHAALPWYSAIAVVPGIVSLLVDWGILFGFLTLLSAVMVIWLLCAGIVLAMLAALLFGVLIKRLLTPIVLPESSAWEVYE